MTTLSKEDVVRMAEEAGYWDGQTCEMNDVGLQHFATLARADLVAEIKQIKISWNRDKEVAVLFDESLRTKLAAAEAREVKLRYELEFIRHLPTAEQYRINEIVNQALAQPSDDSALRSLIAEIYEECANKIDERNEQNCNSLLLSCLTRLAQDFRALAEKAKE